MNPNEYDEIILFLREEKYPEASQASRQTKWNYKRRLSSYFIGDVAGQMRFHAKRVSPRPNAFRLIY